MKRLLFLLLVLVCSVSYGQTYQSMPQAGYGPVQRMLFDSVVTLPMGINRLRNINGGRDTAQIRYNKADSSVYVYTGSQWVKSSGSIIDTTSLSNRINGKLSASDSSTYYTKFRSDSSRTNIYSSIGGKLSASDTANKWVNTITRTLGKDSIIYYIGNIRYAIKDSVGTNPPASGYYGAFQDNTSQTAASINTAYPVKFNTTDLTNGVSVVNDGSSNPTRITLANTGIYNIQFSLQLEKTGGSGNMTADIWIRKNGVDIPSTTGKVVLTGSANASPVVAAWNYVLNLAAGDYVQLMWATTNTNVEIIAAAATSPHPAIPSSILTVTQQSGIMAGTGITAINSLTGSAQTMVTGTDSSDFKIVSTGISHTFNLPTASATNRGALSSANWSTFNGKQDSSTSWKTGGNFNVNAGQFIGSNNNASLRFRTNNTERIVIDSIGSVGIGTSLAAASSLVDITSTGKGLLIPRMTTPQRNAISSPATGLQVYDLTDSINYAYDGTRWEQYLSNRGNRFASGSDYIGTNNNTSLRIRTNGTQKMFIDSLGNVGIGVNNASGSSPLLKFEVASEGAIQVCAFSTYSNTSTHEPLFYFRRGRGTFASPLAVNNGDILGSVRFAGQQSSTINDYTTTAKIEGIARGNFSGGTSLPTDMLFYTTATSSNTPTERMRISASGNIGAGTTSPTSILHTTSFATGYVSKSANYTATISDYTIDCTANTFQVTLPTAVGITGRIYTIVNSGAGTITIGTTSSQTFANVATTPTTLTMATVGTRVVQSNGANWLLISSL